MWIPRIRTKDTLFWGKQRTVSTNCYHLIKASILILGFFWGNCVFSNTVELYSQKSSNFNGLFFRRSVKNWRFGMPCCWHSQKIELMVGTSYFSSKYDLQKFSKSVIIFKICNYFSKSVIGFQNLKISFQNL